MGKLLNAEVTSHGLGATSLKYSYDKFLQHHKNYDINIFLITHFQRYTNPVKLSTTTNPQYFSSINMVQETKKQKDLSAGDLRILNDLESWFMASDEAYMKLAQTCIVRDIKNKNPNTIFIPSFQSEFSISKEQRLELDIPLGFSCSDIWNVQMSSLGLTEKNWYGWNENHSTTGCHFTLETNAVFANILANHIVKKEPLTMPTYIKHSNGLDYYFFK